MHNGGACMQQMKDSKRELLIDEINRIQEERYIRLIYYFAINLKQSTAAITACDSKTK